MTTITEPQAQFIEFLVEAGALRFGEFKTKSGRLSPYFLNMGQIASGRALGRLGEAYATALTCVLGTAFEALFGPAYKGIPLATATGIALARDHGHEVGVGFNRKESKDHGEGGTLVGHRPAPGERVVIVEDVTTAGTSIHETFALFAAQQLPEPMALIVAVDRCERGNGSQSAQTELRERYGLQTLSIVTIDQIVIHLRGRELPGHGIVLDDAMAGRIATYRAEYGA